MKSNVLCVRWRQNAEKRNENCVNTLSTVACARGNSTQWIFIIVRSSIIIEFTNVFSFRFQYLFFLVFLGRVFFSLASLVHSFIICAVCLLLLFFWCVSLSCVMLMYCSLLMRVYICTISIDVCVFVRAWDNKGNRHETHRIDGECSPYPQQADVSNNSIMEKRKISHQNYSQHGVRVPTICNQQFLIFSILSSRLLIYYWHSRGLLILNGSRFCVSPNRRLFPRIIWFAIHLFISSNFTCVAMAGIQLRRAEWTHLMHSKRLAIMHGATKR